MQEILDLTPVEVELLVKRLTLYALYRLRHLTWRGALIAHGGAVPGGYEAQDFVSRAMIKSLDETREWNRDVFPTLEAFLRSIIKSDINHLAESLDNVHGRRLITASEQDETEIVYEPAGAEPDPLSVVIDEEWREQYRAAVLRELNGDPLLTDLLRCYEAAVTKPREIARRLARPVAEIYDALKRFRRKLTNVDTAMIQADNQNRRTAR